MPANLVSLVSFVLIASFTPGPANVSSASMGVLHGYRGTLKYMAGLIAGFFIIMLLSGWLSSLLLDRFPALEPILRYVGAVYILYLAFAILRASYNFKDEEAKPMGFSHGLMLQVLNPKLFVYAFTLFSAFLAPITGNLALLMLAIVLLALTAFCAVSTWALFGTVIKSYLRYPRVKTVVNAALALFLVYTAAELAGIL